MTDEAITIYHNPVCGTSRRVLAALQAAGIAPRVVLYLKTPPDRATLKAIIAGTGEGVRALLREKEALCRELGLDDRSKSDDELLDAMLAHPVLINRPIVVTPTGARLCRPPERVTELLPEVRP